MSFLFKAAKRRNTVEQKFKFEIVQAQVIVSVPNQGDLSVDFIRGPRTVSTGFVFQNNAQAGLTYSFKPNSPANPWSLMCTMYREESGKAQPKEAKLVVKQNLGKSDRVFGQVEFDLAPYSQPVETTFDLSFPLSKCSDKRAVIKVSLKSTWLKVLDGMPSDAISSVSDLSRLQLDDSEDNKSTASRKASDVANMNDLKDFDDEQVKTLQLRVQELEQQLEERNAQISMSSSRQASTLAELERVQVDQYRLLSQVDELSRYKEDVKALNSEISMLRRDNERLNLSVENLSSQISSSANEASAEAAQNLLKLTNELRIKDDQLARLNDQLEKSGSETIATKNDLQKARAEQVLQAEDHQKLVTELNKRLETLMQENIQVTTLQEKVREKDQKISEMEMALGAAAKIHAMVSTLQNEKDQSLKLVSMLQKNQSVLQGKFDLLSKENQSTVEQLKAEISDLQDRNKLAETQVSTLRDQLSVVQSERDKAAGSAHLELSQEIAKCSQKDSELQELNRIKLHLEQELVNLQSNLNETLSSSQVNELKSQSQIASLTSSVETLNRNLKSLEADKSELTLQLNTSSQRTNELEQSLSESSNKVQKLEQSLALSSEKHASVVASLTENSGSLQSSINELQTKICNQETEINTLSASLSASTSQCSSLLSTLEQSRSSLDQAHRDLETNQQLLTNSEFSLQEANKQIASLRENVHQLTESSSQQRMEFSNTKAELESTTSQLSQVQNKLIELRSENQSLTNSLQDALQTVAMTQSKLKSAEGEIDVLRASQSADVQKSEQLWQQQLQNQSQEHMSQLASLNEQINSLHQSVSISKETISALETDKSSISSTLMSVQHQLKTERDEIQRLNDHILVLQQSESDSQARIGQLVAAEQKLSQLLDESHTKQSTFRSDMEHTVNSLQDQVVSLQASLSSQTDQTTAESNRCAELSVKLEEVMSERDSLLSLSEDLRSSYRSEVDGRKLLEAELLDLQAQSKANQDDARRALGDQISALRTAEAELKERASELQLSLEQSNLQVSHLTSSLHQAEDRIAQLEESSQQLSQLQDKNQILQERLSFSESQVLDLQSQIATLEASSRDDQCNQHQAQHLQEQISKYQNEVRELQESLQQRHKDVKEAAIQLLEAKLQLEAQQALVKDIETKWKEEAKTLTDEMTTAREQSDMSIEVMSQELLQRSAQMQELSDDIEGLRVEKSKANDEIAECRRNLDQYRSQSTQLEIKVRELTATLSVVQSQLAQAQQQLTERSNAVVASSSSSEAAWLSQKSKLDSEVAVLQAEVSHTQSLLKGLRAESVMMREKWNNVKGKIVRVQENGDIQTMESTDIDRANVLITIQSKHNAEMEKLQTELSGLKEELNSTRSSYTSVNAMLQNQVVSLEQQLSSVKVELDRVSKDYQQREFFKTYGVDPTLVSSPSPAVSADSESGSHKDLNKELASLSSKLDRSRRETLKLSQVVADLERKYLEKQIALVNATDIANSAESEAAQLRETCAQLKSQLEAKASASTPTKRFGFFSR